MLVDAVALTGAGLMFAGLWVVWPPLAIILAGTLLLALAVVVEVSRVDRRPPPG